MGNITARTTFVTEYSTAPKTATVINSPPSGHGCWRHGSAPRVEVMNIPFKIIDLKPRREALIKNLHYFWQPDAALRVQSNGITARPNGVRRDYK